MNDELKSSVHALENVLRSTLVVDDYVDFETLKKPEVISDFDPGSLAVPISLPSRRD
jgi:hypothetical protein